MAQHELPKLIQDLLYAEDHQLLDDPVGRAMHRVIHAGVADDFVRGMLSDRVSKDQISQAFAGPFRLPKLHDGNVFLGKDVNGRPVFVPIQQFGAHSLTVGGSGCGKTTRSRALALQIVPQVEGAWLCDLRKSEFSILRPALVHFGVDLVIVPARKLRHNPLQVAEHVAPQDFAPRVADMLVDVLALPPRATKLIHFSILDLYDRFGILQGCTNYPVLFELRDAIANNERANPQARQAIVDALDPILMSLGPVLSFRQGWSTARLARRHLVFEFGGVSATQGDLLLSSLILQEFCSRIAQGISNQPLNLWVLADECGRLISASNPHGGICDLISIARGVGIGLDLCSQGADIARSILSNSSLRYVGRCTNVQDLDVMAGAMGLTVEQRRYMSHRLAPGTFIAQTSEGWRHPFLLRIPNPDFSKATVRSASEGAPHIAGLLPL